jgi:type I restriction enzyme S subunit
MKTRTVQLGAVCEFIRGVTFDKADATTRPEFGKTPILRAGNIREELDAQNDLIWVPDARVSDEQRLRQNDIAICMSSGSPDVVGKTARVPNSLRASIGSFCGIVRPRSPGEASYLSFFFRSATFRKHRNAIARGANIQNLRFSQFEEIELEIPSEQQQIAERLEEVDRLRRTRRYALELTDTFLPAAFCEFFGDSRANTKQWESATLGEVITRGPQNGLYKPASAYGAGTPILRIDAFYDGAITELNSLKRVRLFPNDVECFGLSENDIVVNRVNSRPYLGKSALIPKLGEPTVFESNMMRFTLNTKSATPIYVTHYLQTSFVKSQIQVLAKDAVNQSSINQEDVKGLIVRLPPLPLQQRFATLVERVERLRAVGREALRQADHLFASLLNRAFNGEL